MKDMMVNDMCL